MSNVGIRVELKVTAGIQESLAQELSKSVELARAISSPKEVGAVLLEIPGSELLLVLRHEDFPRLYTGWVKWHNPFKRHKEAKQ